jgi:hypothetical protein
MSGHTGKALGAGKSHNRATRCAREWHSRGGFSTHLAPPKTSSWWIAGAAPDAFTKFSELAVERDKQRSWSSIVPHAMNPKGELK